MSHRPHTFEESVSRRAFVVQVGAAAALLGAGLPARAQAPVPVPGPVPGKEKLIVRSPRPINLETPLQELTADVTPTDLFFVRNNYDGPVMDPAAYVLTVDGEVEKRLLKRVGVFPGLVDISGAKNFTPDALSGGMAIFRGLGRGHCDFSAVVRGAIITVPAARSISRGP